MREGIGLDLGDAGRNTIAERREGGWIQDQLTLVLIEQDAVRRAVVRVPVRHGDLLQRQKAVLIDGAAEGGERRRQRQRSQMIGAVRDRDQRTVQRSYPFADRQRFEVLTVVKDRVAVTSDAAGQGRRGQRGTVVKDVAAQRFDAVCELKFRHRRKIGERVVADTGDPVVDHDARDAAEVAVPRLSVGRRIIRDHAFARKREHAVIVLPVDVAHATADRVRIIVDAVELFQSADIADPLGVSRRRRRRVDHRFGERMSRLFGEDGLAAVDALELPGAAFARFHGPLRRDAVRKDGHVVGHIRPVERFAAIGEGPGVACRFGQRHAAAGRRRGRPVAARTDEGHLRRIRVRRGREGLDIKIVEVIVCAVIPSSARSVRRFVRRALVINAF